MKVTNRGNRLIYRLWAPDDDAIIMHLTLAVENWLHMRVVVTLMRPAGAEAVRD